MTRKQKKNLLRIVAAAALMVILHFLPLQGWLRFGLYLLPYLIAGYDVLANAAYGIVNGQIFDENFLMAVATIGALVLGLVQTGDYAEAVAVMVFYQTGELFQSIAVGKSRRSIAALMDIRPDYANIESDGMLVRLDPAEVAVGSVIVVQPGEKIPIDGIVIHGSSALDTAALTGESLPRDTEPGSQVISGCVNLTGVLKIRTTKPFGESTVSKILELTENASSHKSRSEKFISRFARVYTPAVCAAALALLVVPPVVNLLLGDAPMWSQWLYRALTFLVASCPCALVISIPLSFFATIGGAGKAGILIKGSHYIQQLARVKQVVFDKTGTLTQGVFQVTEVLPEEISAQELLELAAHADSASSHPISKGLQQAYGKPIHRSRVENTQEISGHGIKSLVDGREIAVGNGKLMEMLGVAYRPYCGEGSGIYVSIGGRFAGTVVLSDVLKPTAAAAMKKLRQAKLNTVMLTGDTPEAAAQIAQALHIDRFHAGLLPGDKVAKLETLLSAGGQKTVAFVGDGINDAPVLARADVGIAMGALGSDAAIEAADIVLMDDDPEKIVTAITLCKGCLAIVRQNIVFSIAVKILALVMVAMGLAGMWLAIFADVGVMVLAVLNAIRLLIRRNGK